MNTRDQSWTTIGLILAAMASGAAEGQQLRPIVLSDSYQHAKYAPDTFDIRRDFRAFTVSFDSKDDDDGDGRPDVRRVPEWVSQEIQRWEGECVYTEERPGRWATDKELFASGVAPNHDSYTGSGFDRGHMAAKLLAARLGLDADRNTHTLLNAVPQAPRFNQQIWRNLEDHTGAWAQAYGRVWVIQGPVFDKNTNAENSRWIGDLKKGERQVAVPDALFKIVVREEKQPGGGISVETLAFLYPQLGPRYYGRKVEFAHERFLTTIREIEDPTGLSFPKLRHVRNQRVPSLWPTQDEDFKTGCGS